jgi:hypothetical protein
MTETYFSGDDAWGGLSRTEHNLLVVYNLREFRSGRDRLRALDGSLQRVEMGRTALVKSHLGVRIATVLAVGAAAAVAVQAADPWPAEPLAESANLTSIEGPEPNDFHYDLSGASWNPVTRTLWVCRNGPGGDQSKFWALVEDGAGGFQVAYRNGNRGEWTGFGDLESITQADLGEDVVYVLIEGEEHVKAYDVSTYGVATLLNDWNLSPNLPLSGGSGAEGLAFVPNAALAAAGFVDGSGNPSTGTGGMGGLMLVGHQNGGSVFAFDLDRVSGTHRFVGEYRTGYAETAGLEFDRSTGMLYVWHDDAHDTLEKTDLRSTAVDGQSYRQFHVVGAWNGPDHSNNEGIALTGIEDCVDGKRSLFMTVDGGGYSSLRRYRRFSDGCPSAPSPPAAPTRLRFVNPS